MGSKFQQVVRHRDRLRNVGLPRLTESFECVKSFLVIEEHGLVTLSSPEITTGWFGSRKLILLSDCRDSNKYSM
ncbi:hypothetical protein L798_07479 [Zootermopsis nevadensis]|uniref:Uncharacterized protein n=1 Tax=Zootermopsis nevadensis TaxID=136037 RepID=A0A067R5B9_ZOONE|nr:hypothetical protein L798_07479 [Zootermopsis nevadensis]